MLQERHLVLGARVRRDELSGLDETPAVLQGSMRASASVLRTAMAHIEEHLAEPLGVPDIARVAGVSHTHLTRLFRQDTGLTVVGCIRHRRMARARHLLTASTLAIPAIAATVGIPDLQAFNKTCRKELGASPRAVGLSARDRGAGHIP